MASPYRSRSSKKPKPAPKPKKLSEKLEEYGHERRHPSGREWTRIVRNVIAYYNGICHLCDHPGAKQADHLIQYAEGGDDSIGNLRPAHGTANTQKNPCPVCGLNCNNIRGALSVEAGKAKIARRQGKTEEQENSDEGREW